MSGGRAADALTAAIAVLIFSGLGPGLLCAAVGALLGWS